MAIVASGGVPKGNTSHIRNYHSLISDISVGLHITTKWYSTFCLRKPRAIMGKYGYTEVDIYGSCFLCPNGLMFTCQAFSYSNRFTQVAQVHMRRYTGRYGLTVILFFVHGQPIHGHGGIVQQLEHIHVHVASSFFSWEKGTCLQA